MCHVVTNAVTRCVQNQSQNQSQSQSPFLYVTAQLLTNLCPALTTDRGNSDADEMRSRLIVHAASRGTERNAA